MTLDLDDDRNSYLGAVAYHGHSTKAELVRALIDEMRADPALEERVVRAGRRTGAVTDLGMEISGLPDIFTPLRGLRPS